ncbi:MAG TPA: glycosyltransferase family 2 protein [Dehalococcoidia bacterium]|nr:glycosyltransferase family 2 protein [Dehalococcoidia bacterium]
MHLVATVMVGLLTVLVGAVLVPVGLYLLLLTTLGIVASGRRRAWRAGLLRFAILVPAHDEETTIGRLLDSLQRVDYPANRIDVLVVADNCNDRTAAIAAQRGARVFDRHDPDRRGKGYALSWLLARMAESDRRYDVCVVLDADSSVRPDFLRALAAAFADGAEVVQGYYTVLKLDGSRAERLREVALALVHYLRPLAKSALGASSGLKGNGMAFRAEVLARFGWPTSGLAEDVEFHLHLLRAGVRVEFVPNAVVYGEMPGSLRRADSQNLRWEAGRLATIRRQALPLLAFGVRHANLAAVDAAIEQLVPPISVPALLAVIALPPGLLLGVPAVWLPAAGFLAVLIGYLLAGLLLARVGLRSWLALGYLPAYAAWKCLIYLRALAGRGERSWVRTARIATPPQSGRR